MATDTVNFTTGPSILPDIGKLVYNGCTFSPLFQSSVSGVPVEDEAKRTIKYTRLTIEVDGYVTLLVSALDIHPTTTTMHKLLTAQGGALEYIGRGFNIAVNTGGGKYDLAWGAIPELFDFQPLGGGLSAKVKWRVVVNISAAQAGRGFTATWPKNFLTKLGDALTTNLLQFNFETTVSYGEDGFSTLTLRGTLEIPLTRNPSQTTRTLTYTADDMRPIIFNLAMKAIDLSRFRITHRDFNMSRDKRTIAWDISAEEKPFMDLPPSCSIARGTYTVKPARTGPGLCLWLCSMSTTYILRADVPRRQAYLLFLALLSLRMSESERGNIAGMRNVQQQEGDGFDARRGLRRVAALANLLTLGVFAGPVTGISQLNAAVKPVLIDFSVSEGLYLDSKSVTFSATWRLTTTFSHILIASGLWTKVAEVDAAGANLWATSMRDVSGVTSWIDNRADPTYAVVVDFGS